MIAPTWISAITSVATAMIPRKTPDQSLTAASPPGRAAA